jgi:rubredoxin
MILTKSCMKYVSDFYVQRKARNLDKEAVMDYTCSVCGYKYEEKFEKIPFDQVGDDYHCPICNAPKEAFMKS